MGAVTSILLGIATKPSPLDRGLRHVRKHDRQLIRLGCHKAIPAG